MTRRLVDITSSIASLHLPVLASQSSINTRRGSDRNFSRQPKLIFFNLVRLSRMFCCRGASTAVLPLLCSPTLHVVTKERILKC